MVGLTSFGPVPLKGAILHVVSVICYVGGILIQAMIESEYQLATFSLACQDGHVPQLTLRIANYIVTSLDRSATLQVRECFLFLRIRFDGAHARLYYTDDSF